jgi:hypothetical protein
MLVDLWNELRRRLSSDPAPQADDPNDPDAPFAMVGAPLKPRPPLGRSSIAVQPET